MVKLLDEHERTMAFAEVALGQIKSLRQTAVPRNYEIWYVYATGYNSPLNKIINETLARNGKLTEADLEQIYETYLSPNQDLRPHRQGRRARDRRDRRRDEADLRRARHVAELRCEPRQRQQETLLRAGPRSGQGDRRDAGKIHPRDARDQQGAGRPAVAVEDRDQQSPAQPGSDPRREPDRSADRPRQPQIFRPLDRDGRAGRARKVASRCRC